MTCFILIVYVLLYKWKPISYYVYVSISLRHVFTDFILVETFNPIVMIYDQCGIGDGQGKLKGEREHNQFSILNRYVADFHFNKGYDK